jgi:ribose transport system substrate-binding protein
MPAQPSNGFPITPPDPLCIANREITRDVITKKRVYSGPKNFLLILLTASLFLALGILFSACQGSGGKAQKEEKKLTIAVIPMGTTHEFWKAIHAGALTASRELGVEIIWKGPLKEDDRNEQVQIVETMADTGVSALVLSPIDDRALVRPVVEAKRLGIPTIIFNSALQGDHHLAYVSTDNYKGGVLAADYIGSLLKGRGKLILIRVKEGVEGSTKREEGFLQTIHSKFPQVKILSDNQYAGPSTETAYQTTENLLARFSDVEAIFTPNESTTFGCMRALQDHGLSGKVIHIGFDTSKKLIEALEKREILGLILQDPFQMGYKSLQIAVSCLKGKAYEKYIDTGVVLATPENMNEPEIRKLLTPDLSILDK